MLANQYCEIIIDSVRQIVDAETLKLQNNITSMQLGIIIEKTTTKYTIGYNNNTKQAIAPNTNNNYSIGDSVYFSFNGRDQIAIIQGRSLADNEVPIKQLHNYEEFVKMEEFQLVAGKQQLLEFNNKQYTRLGISGIFCSADSQQFEITIKIKADNKFYSFTIQPQDLIGVNFGASHVPILQKTAIELNMTNIQSIQWTSNNTVFVDKDGNNTPTLTYSFGYDLDTLVQKDGSGLLLFIDNEEQLQYKTKYEGGSLVFTTPTGAKYTETGLRDLHLRWIRQDGDSYIGYTQQNISKLPEGIIIKWYHYQEDYTGGDDLAGVGWKQFNNYTVGDVLDSSKMAEWFTQDNITLSPDVKEDKFKAILLLGPNNYIVSNELVFTNDQPEKQQIITRTPYLSVEDGVKDFPWYGIDKTITIEHQYEVIKSRKLILNIPKINDALTAAELDKKIISITWELPSTLFNIPASERYTIVTNNHIHYITMRRQSEKLEEGQTYWSYELPFKIQSKVERFDIPYVVSCKIKLETGEEHEATIEFKALSVEQDGTDNFVMVHLYDEYWSSIQGLPRPTGTRKFFLTVQIYNSTEQKYLKGSDIIEVKWICGNFSQIWSLVPPDESELNNEKTVYELVEQQSMSSLRNIFTFGTPLISISFVYNQITTTYIQPINLYLEQQSDITIPVIKNTNFDSRIWYNTGGILDKEAHPNLIISLQAYNKSNEVVEINKDNNLFWSIEYKQNAIADINAILGLPTINGNNIFPAQILNSDLEIYNIIKNTDINYQCYLILTHTKNDASKIIWAQPIILQQHTAFSTILNQWDGSLLIDENSNRILTAALVAGAKENNRFTGMIAGQLSNLADPNNTFYDGTGIFGFKQGKNIYALKDDGSLTLGATGNGQITIDGSKGYIMSGNWTTEPIFDNNGMIANIEELEGSYWDLTKGIFITDSGYFKGRIEATSGVLGNVIIQRFKMTPNLEQLINCFGEEQNFIHTGLEITNITQEQDLLQWTMIRGSSYGPASGNSVIQNLDFTPGQEYILSFKLKILSGDFVSIAGVGWNNSSQTSMDNFTINSIKYQMGTGAEVTVAEPERFKSFNGFTGQPRQITVGGETIFTTLNEFTLAREEEQIISVIISLTYNENPNTNILDKIGIYVHGTFTYIPSTMTTPEMYADYNTIKYELWDVVLVEDTSTLAWGYSSSDLAQLGNYAWSFSPISGIKMWNNTVFQDQPLLQVDDKGVSMYNTYEDGNNTYSVAVLPEGIQVTENGSSGDIISKINWHTLLEKLNSI